MARRTNAQWSELIEQQQTSGLSAAEFCRRHSVNAKYFSLRKQKLSKSSKQFVQVTAPAVTTMPSVKNAMKVKIIELEIPGDTVSESLAVLLGSLGR